MDWKEYEKYLDCQLDDAKYNLDYATNKYREARWNYENVLLERKAFDRGLDELMEGLK
jgi:hypothetical protein